MRITIECNTTQHGGAYGPEPFDFTARTAKVGGHVQPAYAVSVPPGVKTFILTRTTLARLLAVLEVEP